MVPRRWRSRGRSREIKGQHTWEIKGREIKGREIKGREIKGQHIPIAAFSGYRDRGPCRRKLDHPAFVRPAYVSRVPFLNCRIYDGGEVVLEAVSIIPLWWR
jgi:hypothetical protein